MKLLLINVCLHLLIPEAMSYVGFTLCPHSPLLGHLLQPRPLGLRLPPSSGGAGLHARRRGALRHLKQGRSLRRVHLLRDGGGREAGVKGRTFLPALHIYTVVQKKTLHV